MKLIDILVRELPNRGGWPLSAIHSWCDGDGEIRFRGDDCLADFYPSLDVDLSDRIPEMKFEDSMEYVVTRKQYEAALAGSRPEWDGEGLPPVGCECEALYDSGRNEWFLAKIIGHDNGAVIGRWLEGSGVYSLFDYSSPYGSFRPIRSEAEKKREETILQMSHSLRANGSVTEEQLCRLYSDIAAGYIPHIRID